MVRRALRPETTDGSAANCHDSSAQPATDDPQGGHKPYRLRGRVKVLGWLIAAVFTAFIGTVNALPPLKVVQLLGNACLSPTTLAPKGPFRPRGPGWILWFSLDSVEPHRVNSNDLVGALGAGPRPEGVGRPAAWWRTSHDVLARLMFSSRADSFSPANRLHPHYQRSNFIVPGASSLSRIVYNNHHSFTYAALVA